MLKDIIQIVLGIIVIALILVALAWLFYFQCDFAIPITGCVVEKILAGSVHRYGVHVLKLDIGTEDYIHITTSARVYNVVARGACYEFARPRSGMSYDSVRVVEQ